MPSANVLHPPPLTRLNPWYPGQFGVSGTANTTGLRMDTLGKILYVDPNYPGANTTCDGTDPNGPLSTITAALARCTDWNNDVIYVMMNDDWQYGPSSSRATAINESVVCTKHGVKIVGVCPSGAMGPIWRPGAAGETALTIHGMSVLVEGFNFDGFEVGAGGNAIYSEWDGVTLWGENITIRNCFFSDTIDIGIQLEFSWYCYIHDNVFSQLDDTAIFVDTAGSGAAFLDIYNNTFQDCNIAMTLEDVDDSFVHENRIYNANAATPVACTDEGIVTTGGSRNLISNNWFSCLLPVGAGDWDDLNTGTATDAWVGNWLQNGMAVTTPT